MKHLAWGLIVAACFLVPPSALAQPAAPDGKPARAVLERHCAGCHGGGKAAKGGFGFVFERDRLVSRQLVVPGKAAASELFLRIVQGEMPPSQKARLSDAERKVLRHWIDAGAPPFERPAALAKVLSPAETTALILRDLAQLDPRQRRFMRYLTLTHLARAGRSPSELATLREATGKLLNSLSWHPRLSAPEAVDADATVLRLDLRVYKWTAAAWAKLATAYPYRLQTDPESRALAIHTGSEDAALRADWFVATAARPPFYHDLLQLPTSDRALERLLQVDGAADVQDVNVLRAGFNDSGVSRNNRLLQRHDAAYGALWRSYDFAGNTGRQNLFEHPLGPNTGATSFQPAGGELIFHLPNGLQAYLLVNARGQRIDKAPSEIVADPRRPDQRVETGISCMSCHARGLLPKADQIRAHVEKNAAAFGKPIVETIRALHPRPARFQAQVARDNIRYLKALEPFGVRDPDQEPINLVSQRFEATLDGATAAAELGVSAAELGRLLRHDPELARLLGSLLAKGGTVQRSLYQAHFPELARRLQTMPLAQATPTVEPAFQGHTSTVNCIARSVNGQRAASGGDDHSIRIWELPSGRALACLHSGNAEVLAVAFSHDGRYLLSGGSDRLVRLWDIESGRELRALRGHTGSVRCVAFSPDGKQVVSGADDRSLRIWDSASGIEQAVLTGHTQPPTAVAWSRDGLHLLSSGRDGTLRWWDVQARRPVQRLEGHAGAVLCLALAPDGKTALSGGNDKTVRLWRLTDGKELHVFQGHTSAVVAVQFSADGREVVSSGSQHQAAGPTWRRWDVASRKQLDTHSADEQWRFGCAVFAPDGRHVLVGGPGGFLQLSPVGGAAR